LKSKVYFIPQNNNEDTAQTNQRLKELLARSGILDFIKKAQWCVVKTHFGEEGNTGFIRPEHFRIICDAIRQKEAFPFLSDANTLYRGRRLNSQDHLKLAYEHGFTKEVTGVDVVIPDDTKEEEGVSIEIDKKNIKSAKIARIYTYCEAFLAVSHFKGHILTGFGGAIKNVGMGCATRSGKLAQHCDMSPVVHAERCTGCGGCMKVCPAGAICIEGQKSVIDSSKCIGCASCLAACPTMAMFIDFGAGNAVQEKIAEYSYAVLKDKKGKAGFINFALKINKECDCWGMENPRIAPDVGILASMDPVSIDKASFDLVNKACGKDIFKENHPDQDGIRHLKAASQLGLGSLEYDLITL